MHEIITFSKYVEEHIHHMNDILTIFEGGVTPNLNKYR